MASEIGHIKVGEEVTGVWCPHCLLPSAVSIPLTIESAGGRQVATLGSITGCFDYCQWITPDGADPIVIDRLFGTPCAYADPDVGPGEEDPTRDDHENFGW